MRESRKQDPAPKAAGAAASWTGLEPLEGRLLLAAIEVGITTALPLVTNDTTPALVGTVSDITAEVQVALEQGGSTVGTWDATEDGGGGWAFTMPDPDALADGVYDIFVSATANGDYGEVTAPAGLEIDTAAPIVTVDALTTNVASPELTGTVDDPAAIITVTVDGVDYAAVNNGDDTWTLAAGTIADLDEGTYDVAVAAEDAGGNVGTDATADELIIDLTGPVVTVDALTTNAASPELTGTVDDPAATVTVTVDGVDYPAVNNGDTWTLAAGTIADLDEGTYDVAVAAEDAAGNVGTDATADELIIDLTGPAVGGTTLVTTSASPALAGEVDDPAAAVTVTVRGSTYAAVNNGDGTWSLPQGTITLPNGLYRLTVTATDLAGNQQTDSTAYLLVDSAGPVVTVDKILTTDTTPALTGTVDDNAAEIVVIVNSVAYAAVNNGDGTWTLPDDTAAALGQGVHDVAVAATDALGNTGTGYGVLSIATTVNVTLGAGASSVTYFDADGTKVTLSAGRGNLNVSFTGVNVSVTGTGRTMTVTANGGVMKVAVDVVQDSTSLSVRTAKGGDALATIHSITGVGILRTLRGSNLVIGGDGIDMLGRIQSINVYGIAADVIMNAATLPTRGVQITASVVKDCTIQAAYIQRLSVQRESKNANVTATAITTLFVRGSFENSNVNANTIGAVTLYNVAADNNDVPFGLTAASLKRLTLRQGNTTLVWGRDFTSGILDLFVNV